MAVNQGGISRASVTNRQRISVRLRQNILTPIRWICFWMLRSPLPSASQNSRLSVLPSRRSFAIFLWAGESVYLPQSISNCRFEITICPASAKESSESAAFFAPPGLKLPVCRRYPSSPRSEWPRIRRFPRRGKKESGILGMVQISQIPGNIICGFIECGSLPPGGMVAPLSEFCHPPAWREAATQN